MHTNFADWYRLCTSGPATPGELLEKRWKGVIGLSDCIKVNPIDLVRILHGKKRATAEIINTFRVPFKEADAGFYMSDNDLEVKVLAGAVLGLVMQEEGEFADQAALALIVSSSLVTKSVWCKPFVAIAESYLTERLRTLRAPSECSVTTPATKNLKANFESLTATLVAGQPAESGAAATKVGESLVNLLTTFGKQVIQAIGTLESESVFRREESDILWWMSSGVSRDFNKSFIDLKQLATSIIAGKELADLVSLPGISPARALLVSVIPAGTGANAEKPISIKAAVNAVAAHWREKIASGLVDPNLCDLCPILGAIQHSLAGAKWDVAFKKETGIDANDKVDAVDIAMQTHREFLLLKSIT